ncbi:MAG: sulfate/thiosulfate transport system substrate-binding protein [Frankiaceae bacterium]|jgi:sulfate transport system substrate-binding protein|nr:sulfate/thiosulfate transport system substrate-binding protein [Frankiaceae bacterium]
MGTSRKFATAGIALGAAAALGLTGCSGSSASAGGSSGGKVKLSLVAYSTPQAAYEKIIAAFQKTPAGKNVEFTQSYGASGDQSRAVAAGLPADVVEFSLAPDMKRLVDANLVAPTWDQNQYKGIVTDSVVAIVTRTGNPKGIKDWPDLIKPGVEVITPNPFTSGGARWNVMAAYGGTVAEGASDAQAQAYLGTLFKHVPVQDDSARASLQTFTGGKGDALLSYENDAIFAQQNGQAVDYTVPDNTIKIENPAAVTSTSKHPTQAKAFLDFLYTDTAQKIFSDNGYRPVVAADATRTFPTPSGLFDISKFGGWDAVTTKFFDATNGVLAKIEQGLGVATTK